MAEDLSFPRRFGKYKLLEELAQGGMGAVYLAAAGSRGMEKVCALKVVLPSLATPEYCGRFLDEAKVMVRLTHGNLVQVFDVGEEDDQSFIAMEFVEGQDLRSIWNRCVEVRRAFPVDVAVHIMKEACRGLSYAHCYEGLHLVHRDISPPNVMVTYAGETKVMDFGLAHSAIKLEHTLPGLVFGKVPYMAPEQARGETLDARTDLFALGVILWELLTGRRLFPSKGDQAAEIAERARNPEIPSTRKFTQRVPPGLDAIVLKALAVDPENRYYSAEEMGGALGRFLSTNWPGTDNHRVASFLSDLFGKDFVAQRQKIETLLAAAADLEEAEAAAAANGAAAGGRGPSGAGSTLAYGNGAAPAGAGSGDDDGLIGGRYRLRRKLGEGGMGEVWEAEHEAIGKRVAVKLLHRGYSKSKDLVARFKREARAASRIDNPGITDVTDFGVCDDGRLFFVMELLEGRLLSELIDVTGALLMRDAVEIGLQLCAAMTAAHESGLVHRDLKPDNVMLVPRSGGTERLKILDFGIAKELTPQGDSEMLTRPGTTMGTPEYMAPEQAAGQTADARSDVYAVGVILYEMLTGRAPHAGGGPKEVLFRKLQDPIEPITSLRKDIPEELAAIVTRCLAASPDARPRSMREVALVLEKVRDTVVGHQPNVPISAAMSLPSASPNVAAGAGPSAQAAAAAWRRRRDNTTQIIEHGTSRKVWYVSGAVALVAVAVTLIIVFGTRGGNGTGRGGGQAKAAAMDAGDAAPGAGTNANVNANHGGGPDMGAGPVNGMIMVFPDHGMDDGNGDPDGGMRRRSPRAARKRALALYQQSVSHAAGGRYAAAQQALDELASLKQYRGARALTLTGRANLEFQRGRYRDAANFARRAVGAGGGTRALMIQGNSLLKQGLYQAAAGVYRKVLKRRPNHAEAKRNLAIAQRKLGG